MAIAFYGSEFVVNGDSDDDFAGGATGLANGGFALTYASYPTYSYMTHSYDAFGNSVAGPVSVDPNGINGGVSGKNGGIAQLSNGMLVAAYSASGPSAGNPIDIALTTFPSDLSSFPASVTPGASPTSSYEYNPVLASSRLGGSIVVWQDDNAVYGRPGSNVIAQVFDNDLSGGTAFVVSEPALSGGDQVHPDAAGLTSGSYVVAWQDNSALDGSGAGIRARVFSSNGAIASSEIAVNQATDLDQISPAVAGLAGGGFVAVWESKGDIVARVFNASGGAFTNDIPVAQFTGGGQTTPEVTALADGGFLVAWTTEAATSADGGDGSGSAIKARAFSGAGAPTSAEILVNSVTTNNQLQPVAATLADGRVVVSWTDKSLALLQDSDVRSQILDPRTQGVTVVGTAEADRYSGSAFADRLSGLGGSDQLLGGGGADTLNGGADADVMSGGGGSDLYYVDDAADAVIESTGRGALDWVATSADYALASGAEVEKLSTAASAGTAAINLTGNKFAQAITGNAGANRIDGRAGADTMSGLGGNDTYYVDNAGDRVIEGAGQGTLDWVATSVSYTLAAGVHVELLGTAASGATIAINLTGNAFAQTINGNAGANRLDGKGGADVMKGLGGNDIYYVDNAGDKVIEGVGQGTADWVATSVSYVLGAGVQAEKFSTTNSGAIPAISLMGNDFGQSISGNAGANIISGKAGNDTLAGLGGADVFVFDTALNAATNVDRITDFNVAADTIWLQNAIFTHIVGTGTLTAAQFYKSAAGIAHDANDRIIYDTDSGYLFYDSNGSAAGGSVHFATLTAGLALTNADFTVI